MYESLLERSSKLMPPLICGSRMAHHEQHQIVPQAAEPATGTNPCLRRSAENAKRHPPDDSDTENTMNDPRDFLAFASYGNLGVLLLGIGLLGILIHRKPIRQGLSVGVGLLGALVLCEGGALLHGGAFSLRGSVVVALVVVTACLAMARSLSLRNN